MVKEIIYQTYNWWVDLGTLYSCTTMVNILHQFYGEFLEHIAKKTINGPYKDIKNMKIIPEKI
jgi:hypothetical protein